MYKTIISTLLFILSFVTSTPTSAPVNRVIVIGCDGMGQIYIDNTTFPTINYLFNNSAYFKTGSGRNQLPTVSAPNWNTIITGQPPELSGVISNEWTPNQKPNYTNGFIQSGTNTTIPEPIWSFIKMQNSSLKTGVAISWKWINYLINNDVDYAFNGNENDTKVMDVVLDLLQTENINFLFVHLDQVDHAGHTYGWGSKEYYQAVNNIDHFLSHVLKLIQKNDVLVVTADHGGWRKHHDYRIEASLYVPAIFHSSRIKPRELTTPYNHIDMVPTILQLFSLHPNPTPYVKGTAHQLLTSF